MCWTSGVFIKRYRGLLRTTKIYWGWGSELLEMIRIVSGLTLSQRLFCYWGIFYYEFLGFKAIWDYREKCL
jgi:hypothetical protein